MGYHYPPVARPRQSAFDGQQTSKATRASARIDPRRGTRLKDTPRRGASLGEEHKCSLGEYFERAGRGNRVILRLCGMTKAMQGAHSELCLFGDCRRPRPLFHQSRPAEGSSSRSSPTTLVLKWPGRRILAEDASSAVHPPAVDHLFINNGPCPWTKVLCTPLIPAAPYLGRLW